MIKRTRFAMVLSLVVLVGLPGCGHQDSGQPAMGSIAVKAKTNGLRASLAKKGARPFRASK